MSDRIIAILKKELDELAVYGELSADVRQNKLKEALQYLVLNFIYHHPEYSKWVMYGGSALRIIHGLDRMSVDLDFEVAQHVDGTFLEELRKEIETYFANTYGTTSDFLTLKTISTRSLLLKFNVGDVLDFGHASKQVHVKIDLNHFVAPKTVTEHRPINHGQVSFVILTYNKGALMASKIAAIFLREERGIGDKTYEYKGRDIYDLLWYMREKTVPDFDYLNAKLTEKGMRVPDIRALFDKLTIDILNYEKMDDCLKDDLSFLFENPFQFDNWLKTWRKDYLKLLDNYKIRTVKQLDHVVVYNDLMRDTYSFIYWYKTEENNLVRIVCTISDYWTSDPEGDLTIEIDKELEKKMEFSSNGRTSRQDPQDKLKQYATLFYKKTESYFKKTNRVMLGDLIATKVIRMTADNLNPKEQILLNRSALESRELDDFLK
ncbi:MAG: nucleotidyl transferase AbiEii/AbiGii toxin family protein [Candidatus Harrisonbacteria bacterium]|nr:nucleotidyl transferase AbiEii/AbiGii toxin family protein [Candidatus Harrisonbacteria bacterium]